MSLSQIEQFFRVNMGTSVIPVSQIMAVLLFTVVMSAVIFLVYRLISHRSLYNKSLNISIAVLPFFIGTIILCLQSNIVITLGTIGALAIIRFRTAVKDPVDMVYLLWAIHLGIMAGCQLFMASILTSAIVIVVLFVLENIRLPHSAHTLVVHCSGENEQELLQTLKPVAGRIRIKSRTFSSDGANYVFDLSVRNAQDLCSRLSAMKELKRFSLLEYDSEDIV